MLFSTFHVTNALANSLENFWTSFTNVIKGFSFPVDLIDILVMAFIIYQGIRLVRETRAMQLVRGIVAILIVYFIASVLNMITLGFFMQNMLQVGILLVVLFQPELRSALERMGRTRLSMVRFGIGAEGAEEQAIGDLIDVLVNTSLYLAERKTGALIVVERQTKLGDVIRTGTVMDAVPSQELIANIFFINSPLHDGAMIIRGCRVHAAGCYLPLSANMEIARDFGTRHRAALGLSEVSDAVVIVVSEETGSISIASDAKLQRGLSEQNLRKLLQLRLIGSKTKEEPKRKVAFWKGKK